MFRRQLSPATNRRSRRWPSLAVGGCLSVCLLLSGCRSLTEGQWKWPAPPACPGCHAWSREHCECGPSPVAAGYHPTHWRTLEPSAVVISRDYVVQHDASSLPHGLAFEQATEAFEPHAAPDRKTVGPIIEQVPSAMRGEPEASEGSLPPPSLIAPQSYAEPIGPAPAAWASEPDRLAPRESPVRRDSVAGMEGEPIGNPAARTKLRRDDSTAATAEEMSRYFFDFDLPASRPPAGGSD